MSDRRTTLPSLAATMSQLARRAVALAAAWRSRRADARARAICPVNSWAFSPLYSNGRCPLCGWAPEGYAYAPPLLTPYERYWGMLAGIGAVSLVMCIAVLVAYLRG